MMVLLLVGFEHQCRRCCNLAMGATAALALVWRPPEELAHWRVVRDAPGRTRHMVRAPCPQTHHLLSPN